MNRLAYLAVLTVALGGVIGGCPPGWDGTDDGPDPNSTAGGPTFERFEQVWTTFDQHYSYFDYKGIDWGALYEQYAPAFENELSADDFAAQLAIFLRELDDLHVNVQKPDGTYLEVATRDVPLNYTSTPRNRYTVSGYQTLGDNTVWHAWLTGNVAYIRVDTLSGDAFSGITTGQIDAIFATYAGATGFIVDIRPNSGGDETIAALFAGHFTDAPVVYGYTETRNGPAHDDFDALATKTLAPAAENRFAGKVVCLIGARNMSSAEWFTLMMRACGATLIGDQTRGSSGNPQTFALDNGVNYTVPTWIAYTDEMKYIEDRGITPDIEIPASASFDDSHDYVVERALEELAK